MLPWKIGIRLISRRKNIKRGEIFQGDYNIAYKEESIQFIISNVMHIIINILILVLNSTYSEIL